MTDALRNLSVEALRRAPKDPRALRGFRRANGEFLVPPDLAARALNAAQNRGRPRVVVNDADRDAWEENLALVYLWLVMGDSSPARPSNERVDGLIMALETAEAALTAANLHGEWLTTLPIRLRFAINEVRQMPRRKAGDRADAMRRAYDRLLLSLYVTAFSRPPGTDPSGPAGRFVHEVWSIAINRENLTPEHAKRIGTADAAVKRSVRLVEDARRPGKEPITAYR